MARSVNWGTGVTTLSPHVLGPAFPANAIGEDQTADLAFVTIGERVVFLPVLSQNDLVESAFDQYYLGGVVGLPVDPVVVGNCPVGLVEVDCPLVGLPVFDGHPHGGLREFAGTRPVAAPDEGDSSIDLGKLDCVLTCDDQVTIDKPQPTTLVAVAADLPRVAVFGEEVFICRCVDHRGLNDTKLVRKKLHISSNRCPSNSKVVVY